MNNEESFSSLDLHFANLLGRLSGGRSPELDLAAALLVCRQRTSGHVCLSLREIGGQPLPVSYNGLEQAPEADDWILKLKQTEVVGVPGEFRPLILDDQGRLYLRRYWEYEARLAAMIKSRLAAPPPVVDLELLRRGLAKFFPQSSESDRQKIAAFAAVTTNFSVITGGPGTGKTRTVAIILALLLEQARREARERFRISLAAPSGKAAARLRESVQSAKNSLDCPEAIKQLLPNDATTIHRLLGTIPDSPYFIYSAEHQISTDLVVVDEASMIDLALMSKLFQAVPSKARVILLGDKDQLASVEAGNVFGDICNSGSSIRLSRELQKFYASSIGGVRRARRREALIEDAIVELERNYRFKENGGIFRLCRAVNAGDAQSALAVLTDDAYGDVLSKQTPVPAALFSALRSQVISGFERYLQIDDPAEALANFGEFRILCAVRRGPYGVEELNGLAERALGDAGILKKEGVWYRGRPVIITRNDYNLRLFNGDIGIALPDEQTKGDLRVFFAQGNGLRKFPPSRLPPHETAFAMTVHKSQGSEFGSVLLILPAEDAPILTRELVYTGLTRARRRVEIWSPEHLLPLALSRRVSRASGLRDALWKRPVYTQLEIGF